MWHLCGQVRGERVATRWTGTHRCCEVHALRSLPWSLPGRPVQGKRSGHLMKNGPEGIGNLSGPSPPRHHTVSVPDLEALLHLAAFQEHAPLDGVLANEVLGAHIDQSRPSAIDGLEDPLGQTAADKCDLVELLRRKL